ncbi:MAG TPA: restriction endonuclease subunit S [Rhodanobacter sp.]
MSLGAVYEFSSGLSKPRSAFGFGYPFLSFKDVFYNSAVPRHLSELVNSTERERECGSVMRGDVFLTRTSETVDELGMSCVALADVPNATFNGFTKRLRPKRARYVVPEFARYYFRSSAFRQDVYAMSSPSTRASLNNEMLGKLTITLPSYEEQIEIGNSLGVIDDRIDLLRETNTTLEAIAQALFKSWFVDFDPVHAKAEGREPEAMDAATAALFPSEFEESELGLTPKGWCRVPVGTIYDVGIGKTPPRKEAQWFSTETTDVPWASIRDMGSSGCFLATTSEFLTREAIDRFHVRLVPEETVLMSFKLTVGRLAITDCEMTTNEAIAHFKSKRGSLPQSYLYGFLRTFNMDSLGSTSSIANATNSKAVRQIPLLYPSLALAQVFDELAGPLIQRIRSEQRQIATLATLRDTLLPRLISGKLRLSEATAELGEAAQGNSKQAVCAP